MPNCRQQNHFLEATKRTVLTVFDQECSFSDFEFVGLGPIGMWIMWIEVLPMHLETVDTQLILRIWHKLEFSDAIPEKKIRESCWWSVIRPIMRSAPRKSSKCYRLALRDFEWSQNCDLKRKRKRCRDYWSHEIKIAVDLDSLDCCFVGYSSMVLMFNSVRIREDAVPVVVSRLFRHPDAMLIQEIEKNIRCLLSELSWTFEWKIASLFLA